MRALSPKALREVRETLAWAEAHRLEPSFSTPILKLIAEIDRALSPKRGVAKARKEKAAKKATRRELVAEVRPAVMARAAGQCECGCGRTFNAWSFKAEWDEFWGRGKVRSTVENTWALAGPCHYWKTNSGPSRRYWLEHYRAHCIRHGYWAEAAKAGRELDTESLMEASEKAGDDAARLQSCDCGTNKGGEALQPTSLHMPACAVRPENWEAKKAGRGAQ